MKRVATGIYRTSTGFRAFVRVSHGSSGLKTKTYPPDTGLTVMKQWRESQRVKAREQKKPDAKAGTLADDIARYLSQIAAMPSLSDRTRDLEAWRAVFGDMKREDITKEMIGGQLQAWRAHGPKLLYMPKVKIRRRVAAGLSASACNHRRTALLHLWTILDGKEAPNPVKAVPPFKEPAPEPRARDLALLTAAISRLRNEKQRTIARVLLWTGIRGNSELTPMKPEHVNHERAECYVPTGKNGRTFRTVPLNADGLAAWADFGRLQLWGKPYDRHLLRKSLARACRAELKARNLPLTRVKVYDLRHSIATAYRRGGADLADVQHVLGHSTPRMTSRYAPFDATKIAAVGKGLEQGS